MHVPELKFGKWILSDSFRVTTTTYNIDGYVEFFEELIVSPEEKKPKPKPTLIEKALELEPESCSISGLVSEIRLPSIQQFPYTPFTYREIYAYNYPDNMVERKILHKCENCSGFTLAEKTYTKYESGELTGFASNGKLTFKSTEKSENGKNIQIFYDAKGKIKCKNIEDENGITEYYNADEKLMGKEKKKNYKVREVEITEIWTFNDKKKIFELSEKTTKTEVSDGVKVTSESRLITTTEVFDKNTKLLIQYNDYGVFAFAPGKYKFEYEFDSTGNWTKKTELKEVTKFGKTYFEPYKVIKREIAYY